MCYMLVLGGRANPLSLPGKMCAASFTHPAHIQVRKRTSILMRLSATFRSAWSSSTRTLSRLLFPRVSAAAPRYAPT
jgi:hypothetical protein